MNRQCELCGEWENDYWMHKVMTGGGRGAHWYCTKCHDSITRKGEQYTKVRTDKIRQMEQKQHGKIKR